MCISSFYGDMIYINKNNFVDMCKPCISLNGNYTATEDAFVKALEALQGRITMLVIAHRLSTVENCDRTIRLDG